MRSVAEAMDSPGPEWLPELLEQLLPHRQAAGNVSLIAVVLLPHSI